MNGWILVLAIVVVGCTQAEPRTAATSSMPAVAVAPHDAAVADRCLPVLSCGDCPGPCSAGANVKGFADIPVTIRNFCVGATCTDVFDPHRPCKDLCAPPVTIDTTCHFDAQHQCRSATP